ncbi:major capsid family protein [Yersinia massiliensis]|uniref:major capsid family protein n=1 Tax=Yersinia massiliensis TaxID=419257 RepID=UPI001CFCA3A9|nr:major capsid family protein [Yersinia massiliensis]MCB5308343.1 DUF2184 domain-containing protein [Yersinia massiliensis]
MNKEHLQQFMGLYVAETMANKEVNVDSQGVLFADELISLSDEVYKYEMPAPVALTMFQQEPGVSKGAQWVAYKMYSAQGMAKIMASYGTDMPMMNVKGTKYFAKMYPIGLGYGYTYDEMLGAATSGVKLDSMLGVDCREIHERTLANIIWNGDEEYDIVGFSNHPNIPLIAVKGNWGTAPADDIISDVVAVISVVNGSSIYNTNKINIPSVAWPILQGTRLPGTSSTVLKFLREAFPEITFQKNSDLDISGEIMGFDMSRRHFAQATPIIFEQLPVQRSGLDISIPCMSKTAGVIVRAPLAAAKSTKVL